VSDDSPVIVLGFYRGGTTLLQRALNCFRGLVVWGEHAGFLKDLARSYAAIGGSELKKVDTSSYSTFTTFAGRFVPWANGFDDQAFLSWQRRSIATLFTVDASTRWGFKEIRYNDIETLLYLTKLFPGARFLFLTRNPQDILVSRLLVRWETRFDHPEEIEACCMDFEREWQTALGAAHQLRSEQRNLMFVSHEDLVAQRRFPEGFCEFLRLDPASLDTRLLNATLDRRAGSSFGDFRNRSLGGKQVSARVDHVRRFVAASQVLATGPAATAPPPAVGREAWRGQRVAPHEQQPWLHQQG
jgi:hypothetical protein